MMTELATLQFFEKFWVIKSKKALRMTIMKFFPIYIHFFTFLSRSSSENILNKNQEPLLMDILDLCSDFGFLKYSMIHPFLGPYKYCIEVKKNDHTWMMMLPILLLPYSKKIYQIKRNGKFALITLNIPLLKILSRKCSTVEWEIGW